MIKGLFGGTLPLLERTLDLTALRQKLISSNIANEETPGYKAKDIDFGKELKSFMNGSGASLTATHSGHISMGVNMDKGANILESKQGGSGLDGNNVSLEKEMVKMSENGLRHEAAMTILARKFSAIRNLIESER